MVTDEWLVTKVEEVRVIQQPIQEQPELRFPKDLQAPAVRSAWGSKRFEDRSEMPCGSGQGFS